MIGFWRQMRLLLWKGVLVKTRQKFWLFVELLVPLILFIILALVRTRDFTDFEDTCHYDSRGFPSAGILPTLHSLLCSFSNQCHQSPTTGDEKQFINNGTSKNESLLVDLLYYSSLQLGHIGKNPSEFSLLLDAFTRLVKTLARLNASQVEMPVLNELLHPSFGIGEKLVRFGMTENASVALRSSRVKPTFLPELLTFVDDISSTPVFLLPFKTLSPVPFLCNRTIFDKSFKLSNGLSLSVQDRRSLCNVTTADLLTLNVTEMMANIRNYKLPSKDNLTMEDLTEPLIVLARLGPLQPLRQAYLKWSHLFPFSTHNITLALFCGGVPFDVTGDLLESSRKRVKTPFDELRQELIDFVDKIVPGRQKRDKQFCHNIWVRDDLNCSSLETALMQRLRPLFTGYILVTPPSPVVQRMIDILNNPLRLASFLRQELFRYPEIADLLQDALYGSDFRTASMNLLTILKRFAKDLPLEPETVENIEFALEHVFAPSTDPYSFGAMTKNFTETVNDYAKCFLMERFVTVANESIMEQAATCLTPYQQYFTGVVIVNMTDNATEFDPVTVYKIRHLPSFVDGTWSYEDSPRRVFDRNSPFTDMKYLAYGFSFLQEAIDRAIIAIRVNSTRSLGMYGQQEPYPCVAFDTFNVAVFLGLFFILSFIIPAALLVKNIVYEKELRLKEQMRIMGLGDMVHLWSWAIISLVLNLTSVLIISIIIKFGNLLTAVDLSLIFVFLSLFAISSIALCLLLSTFFTNANISTAATCLVFFLLFYPYQLSVKAKNKTFTQFTLIFPQTTLGYGTAMLAIFSFEEKATWKDIHSMYLPAYDVSFLECMVAFVLQTLLFLVLAWYKSAVSPGIYGVSLPWYFCFTKQYWFPESGQLAECDITDEPEETVSDSFDSEPVDMKLTVHIYKMSKIYSNGTRALDNLNLRLYEDHITALLGHNGAGKTTTMSILCGLYSPSSGSASVYGMDIRREMRRVRDVLGVCPQYNVLFSHLTVAEQLKLFAALKGTPDEDLQKEVDDILTAVSLVDKANDLASTLSGGMKRRLCIGIALVGGSKFVILDEPTAGVDVTSRKEIWSLLQDNKKGRTILLSTHHMDEADVLSNRIALLSEGRLIALGSSMFLKNKYGEAFQVFACKKDRAKDYTSVITRITTEAMIPIKLSDETEDELVFSIPISTDSRKLEKFFKFFDANKDSYMLGEYGISAPTLQEIFVRLSPKKDYVVPRHRAGILSRLRKGLRNGAVQSDERGLIKATLASASATYGTTSSSSNTRTATTSASASKELEPQFDEEELLPAPLAGWELTVSHMKALLKSRCQYTLRSKKNILFEVILPICLLYGCELYAKIQFSGTMTVMVTSQPPLPLTAEMYGNDTYSYVSLWDRDPQSVSFQLMKSFEDPPYMGTRCVNNVPMFRRELAGGCDPELGNGTFDWDANETAIPYNADIVCECRNMMWNCTAEYKHRQNRVCQSGLTGRQQRQPNDVFVFLPSHVVDPARLNAEEDYPLQSVPMVIMNTTMRVWDMSYRNISQMRLATRWSINGSPDRLPVLGGVSLGHTSLRAKNSTQIQSGIDGWHLLITGLNQTARNLNVSMISGSAPVVVDPFVANITMSDFVAVILQHLETRQNAKVWFNNKLYTSLPVFTEILSNALLRVDSPTLNPSDLGIIAINHPMNQTVQSVFDSEGNAKLIVFRIVLIMLVLCVIPAGFSVFLVEDRVCDAFHLQLVSGLSRRTYWLTSYAFDMTIYTVSLIVILLVYVIFEVKEFAYSFESLCSFFLVFFLYGLCAVLWAYILQRRFDIPALSFVLISIGTFFVGIVATLTVIVIEQLMQEDPTLIVPHSVCSTVFLLLPQYSLGMAIFRGSFVFQLVQIGENFLRELNRLDLMSSLPIPSLLQWSLMGMHCLCLVIHIIIAVVLLFIFEREPFGFLRKWEQMRTRRLVGGQDGDADEDVVSEKRKVDQLDDTSDKPLIVKDLAKAYTKKVLAVQNVSFAVDEGECFGLLGLNGAGKTTTFAILTQKIRPGCGTVRIHGRRAFLAQAHTYKECALHDIRVPVYLNSGQAILWRLVQDHLGHPGQAFEYHWKMVIGDRSSFEQVGYCPQFDALNMKLTTIENIELFAKIRGVPEKHIQPLVSRLLQSLNLKPYSSTVTAALSGGNRRKLSVAIALISHPSLILLDEPSAGMDPGSQQFLWRVIDSLRKSGKAVVITSHSMEECEALCTRIAIMDRGRIRCIGSKQHLKNKFGEGHSLTMKMKCQDDARSAAKFVVSLLKGAKVESIHCSTVFLHIDRDHSSISDIYRVVNQLKAKLPVEDFSLSQSTLAEVFYSLASHASNTSVSSDQTTSTVETDLTD